MHVIRRLLGVTKETKLFSLGKYIMIKFNTIVARLIDEYYYLNVQNSKPSDCRSHILIEPLTCGNRVISV